MLRSRRSRGACAIRRGPAPHQAVTPCRKGWRAGGDAAGAEGASTAMSDRVGARRGVPPSGRRRGSDVGEVAVNRQARASWDQLVADQLDEVRAAGRWRVPRDLATSSAVTGALAGTGREPAEVVSFASNDYLGLTHHPDVRAAACEAIERWGTGTGASRLVVGSRPLHAELEAELAAWKGTEDAVLFPTGYHANLGLLTTLAGADVTVLSDELNHASIVDGCRLARARVQVVAHRDLDRVDAALAAIDGPALVVTDSAFSMDGDAADVEGLLTVCSWYGALLVIDEAHAVLGPDVPAWALRPAAGEGGRGPLDPPLLRMGTLSKSLGSLGGYVAGASPTSTCCATGPGRSSSPPRRRPPTPPPAWPPCACCARPTAPRWSPASATWSTGSPPATPPRSCRSCSATRTRRSRPRPSCWSGACWCRPSARRPWPRARRGCGWRCRPPTPTTRSRTCCARWPTSTCTARPPWPWRARSPWPRRCRTTTSPRWRRRRRRARRPPATGSRARATRARATATCQPTARRPPAARS